LLTSWTLLIAAHAVAASAALIIGPFQLWRRPKGDKIHRVIGRIWVGLMLFVAAGSFLFGGYSNALDVFLRALAVWTLISTTAGILLARRGNIRHHRGFMIGTYLGLLGAFVGVVAVRRRLVPSWFAAHPMMMSIIVVAIIAVTGFLIAAVVEFYRRQPAAERA
jgi:uncharacterized membrane protein